MLRKPMLLPLLSLLAAAQALAQQQPPAAPPATPPQQVEPIEKGAEPPLIPPKEPTTRIVERKVGNEVVEAKVSAGGSNYTLKPNQPVGNSPVGSVDAGPSRAPAWTVLQFGTKKPKDAEQAAEAGQDGSTPAVRPGERAPVPPPPRLDPATPVK